MKQIWSNGSFQGQVDTHEFNVSEIEDKTILTYSDNGVWQHPDEEAGAITSTGDGYIINIGDEQIEIDYSEAFIIMSLLLLTKTDKFEIRELTTTMSI